jgi:hypothetical protein
MKKIFLIIILSLWTSSAYAEKINLACTEQTTNTVLSFTINTDDKTVSTQGSNYDPYLYSNGVFTFLMKTQNNYYLYRLNRNTGVLGVKSWEQNEEEYQKMTAKLFANMLADGKTTNDADYVLNYVINFFEQNDDYISFTLACAKTEPKF